MLLEGLLVLLTANSGVTTILGTPSTRSDQTNGIFAGQMPEATPNPAIVYDGIHEQDLMSMDGADPFTGARLDLYCFGGTYAQAKKLARAIRQCLEPLNNNGTVTLSEGTEVDNIHRVSEHDVFDYAPQQYVTAVEFQVFYRDVGS